MSIKTKEVPEVLGSFLKAKGQMPTMQIAPTKDLVIVENSTEVPANSDEDLEDTAIVADDAQDTQIQNQEPVDSRDYKQAWIELKQYHDKAIYEEREKNRQLEQALASASKPEIKRPKTPEEMKEFKEQYGEVVDIIRTIVLEELQDGTLAADVKSKLDTVLKSQTELKEKEAFAKLLQEHPDADDIRKDPKFAKWFNEQPDDIKRILATSTDYKAISKQLTLYKIEMGIVNPVVKKDDAPKKVSTKAAEAAMGVDVKGAAQMSAQKKVWTASEVKEITKNYKQWLKHREEIDLARREGRYDPTK